MTVAAQSSGASHRKSPLWTSKDNYFLKKQQDMKQEDTQMVYGIRPVIEAIDAGMQIDKIMIQNGLQGDLMADLRARIKSRSLPFQFVPVEKLNHLTRNNHQGVVATISPIRYCSFVDLSQQVMDSGHAPFFVLLDHLTDVRNMGAIARTAECAGVDALVVPAHGSAQMNADAIKTSAGALLRLPVCREENLKTVVNLARQLGWQVVAATEKSSKSYLSVDFVKPTLLIMGAEDKGITTDLLKLSEVRAQIPIKGEIQSLNVSVAASIFIYEALRQRTAMVSE